MSVHLNRKEAARRTFMLEGSMWLVLVKIAAPLVLYNSVSQIFSFFDTVIAAHIGANVVSTVSFVAQIQSMFAAIGSGLSVGGGIVIARHYGAGDMEKTNRNINTLMCIALAVALGLVLLLVPFARTVLRLLNMPEELLGIGTAYFMLETLQLVCVFVNTIYFAVEKSRGNTKRIMYLNFLVLSVKFSLTLLFVFAFGGGILMISLATLLAQSTLTAIAIIQMTKKDSAFRLSPKSVDLSSKTLRPILALSLPVFLEKFAFSFGKVTVNSMSASYGSTVIGALGISNRLGGMCTMPPIGVQEAEASLISQNLGNKNLGRALGIFKRAFILNLGLGAFFYVLMWIFMEPVIYLFAKGDPSFAAEIRTIYVYERDATIMLAGASAAMGLLYGFGWTRISMVLNILRLFAYRIPPLWYIQRYTDMGSEGVGYAMLISNVLFSVTAIATAFFLVLRVKRNPRVAESDLTAPLP